MSWKIILSKGGWFRLWVVVTVVWYLFVLGAGIGALNEYGWPQPEIFDDPEIMLAFLMFAFAPFVVLLAVKIVVAILIWIAKGFQQDNI